MYSCQWGDEIVSLVQPNPDDFAVLYSDTSTVQFSTVVYDSLMTGGVDRLIVGQYNDPYLGAVTAQGFTQPELQGSITLPDDAVYDSLDVFLNYDGYYYGDTTQVMKLSVHAVTEDILLRSSYFNTSVLPYDEAPLGTLEFRPRPSLDSVKVRLSDELGLKIFDLAKNNLMRNSSDWYNVLQGITLKGDSEDNNVILGIAMPGTGAGIRLHYHVKGLEGNTVYKEVVALNYSYNKVMNDRTGTELATGTGTKRIAIPSEKTNNMSFIQEGMGVFTRVDFPYFDQLKYAKYSVANRALLKIYPVNQSVTERYNAPSNLYLYYVNKNNEFGSEQPYSPQALASLDGRTQITGTYIDNIIDNEQYYVFDVSAFISNIMFSDYKIDSGLGIFTSELVSGSYPEARMGFAKGVSRLVIGNQKMKIGSKNSKLELYYTTVKYE
ncbi:DUF4270 family protein [Dyadobacter jejuensis]|uniref:DUF4270 family protein n=1 Tax=Dyadobacter jejuensis TaxID=1082580 RepID=UPI001304A873|nr:DUF4270 family protein [Dyadobacter jejuensis]